MRPVDRGAVPEDADGNAKEYAEYADARSDLFARLGRYCSFCERPIKAGLAVEHVLNKDKHPHLEREWTNFLLACVNCNSTKGTKAVHRKQCLLPDQDNTFRGLTYHLGGKVLPEKSLKRALKSKATHLVRLVGLDKSPTNDPQAKDLRWNDRREAWDKATRYRKKYETGTIGVEEIVELCKADGHWSIWMTVFDGDDEVRIALIGTFPGTPSNCFDVHGNPIPRTGGHL